MQADLLKWVGRIKPGACVRCTLSVQEVRALYTMPSEQQTLSVSECVAGVQVKARSLWSRAVTAVQSPSAIAVYAAHAAVAACWMWLCAADTQFARFT